MRILVLTINYWPEQTGIAAVLTRRCEYLAAAGHEVTVCTGMPYYPEWRIHPRYTGKMFSREEHNGVDILRSWIWVPREVTSAKRVLFEASFLANSLLRGVFHAMGRRKPELLLVVSPPLGLALSAVLLGRVSKVPYVFDVQDLQPDAAADLGMLPRPVLPVLYRLEKIAYRHATLISTVTEGMRQRIVGKGVPPEKVVVVPPPADRGLFDVGGSVMGARFRSKYGLEGKFVVAHSGNMGVKQGLGLVLDAASQLRERREIVFLLAGDGVMKASLESKASALKLDNVRFLPLQDREEFLQMLAAIDLALIIQQPTLFDIAFPSKTVTLLSAARPVAAAVSSNSEIDRVLRQSKAGVVTEPEDTKALTSTIENLFRDPAKRVNMGENGRRHALQYWDESQVLSDFESHLSEASGAAMPMLAEEPAA